MNDFVGLHYGAAELPQRKNIRAEFHGKIINDEMIYRFLWSARLRRAKYIHAKVGLEDTKKQTGTGYVSV